MRRLPVLLTLSALFGSALVAPGCSSEDSRPDACSECGSAQGVGGGSISGQGGSGTAAGSAGAAGTSAAGSTQGACSPLTVTLLQKNDILLANAVAYGGEASINAAKVGGGSVDKVVTGGSGVLDGVDCSPQWVVSTPTAATVLGFLQADDMKDATTTLFVVGRDLLDQIAAGFGSSISDGSGHILVDLTLADGSTTDVDVTVNGAALVLYHAGSASWSKVPTVAKTGTVLLTNVGAGDVKLTLTKKGATPVERTVPVLSQHITFLTHKL